MIWVNDDKTISLPQQFLSRIHGVLFYTSRDYITHQRDRNSQHMRKEGRILHIVLEKERVEYETSLIVLPAISFYPFLILYGSTRLPRNKFYIQQKRVIGIAI